MTHPWLSRPTVPGHGPSPSTFALIGEAPGLNETIYRQPFVGHSGAELNRMLAEADIDRKSTYVTNVFKIRPDGNDLAEFLVSRTHPDACLALGPVKPGKWLHRDLEPMVRTLVPELVGVGVKVAIALGGTALWGLLGLAKISAYVGTVHPPTPTRPFTVVPTYHPSAILRNWSLRSTAIANLQKARAALPTRVIGSARKEPILKLNPTLEEVHKLARRAHQANLLAVDIETAHGQIRTIAFAISPQFAFVVPFWEPPAAPYWHTHAGEMAAWEAVRHALAGPGTKIFHNGAYDIQYLWRVHGIPVKGPIEDTMLLHHAMEPELPKSLGHLAAVYLQMPEWKTSRAKAEKDED